MRKREWMKTTMGIVLIVAMVGGMFGWLPVSVSRVQASPGIMCVLDDYPITQAAVHAPKPDQSMIGNTYTSRLINYWGAYAAKDGNAGNHIAYPVDLDANGCALMESFENHVTLEGVQEAIVAQAAEEIAARRTTTPPAIDGVLDDLWGAPQLEVVFTLNYQNHPLKAYFLYDDDCLYIAVEVKDKELNDYYPGASLVDVMEVYFDNNNNGVVDIGETILNFWGLWFGDWIYKGGGSWGTAPNPSGASGAVFHNNPGGRGDYVYEFQIPRHLFASDTVGIKLNYRVMEYDSGNNRYTWSDQFFWPLGGRFDGATYAELCMDDETPSPVALFDYAPQSPIVSGHHVEFRAHASFHPDVLRGGEIVNYIWDFGDGTVESGEGRVTVTHQFRGHGHGNSKTYDVTLTVEDNIGATDTIMSQIVVLPLSTDVEVAIPILDGYPWDDPWYATARLTVWYNWVDEVDGQNIYIVSKARAEADAWVGYYSFFIHSTRSSSDPAVIWWDLLSSYIDKTYYGCFSGPTFFPDFSRLLPKWEPKECAVFWYGKDALTGFEVYGSDVIELRAIGIPAGVHIGTNEGILALQALASGFAEVDVTCFDPEYGLPYPGIRGIDYPLWGSTLASPGELRVYDSQGRITGVIDGDVVEQIPDSLCTGSDVFISSARDSYTVRVVGTEDGTYGLSAGFIRNPQVGVFAATDIPTTDGAVHDYSIDWDALAQGEDGITIEKDHDGDGEIDETTITGMPQTPTDPSPADNATEVSLDATLIWTGDYSGSVTYNIYFGTTMDPPLVSERQEETAYTPTLNLNTTYYWRIVAINEHGISSAGPVWSFAAEGLCQDEPSPDVGFASIADSLVIVLLWQPATQSWDLYFPLTGDDTIGTLEAGRAYFIYVDADCTLVYGTRVIELYAGWNNPAWMTQ